MRVIHKHAVLQTPFTIYASPDMKIVHFGYQQGSGLCLWYETDAESPSQPARKFHMFGTGNVIPTGLEHVISTIAEPFVWHIYK